jgi:gluconokinase
MSENVNYFIGVDIGTTGCRVCIFSANGDLASVSDAEYPLEIPQAGWAEQDPEVIYAAFCHTLSTALGKFPHPAHQIKGMGFSAVFHSLFPVDEAGAALHPMLTWADSRSQANLKSISEHTDLRSLYERTGCPLHPMYPLAKLLWFKTDRPEIFKRAHKFVSIKEFLIHRLTGEFLVDKSIASGTGLFNSKQGNWDAGCLHLVGLPAEKLSKIVSTTHTIAKWKQTEFGLDPGVTIVMGAGDGVLSTLGAGAIAPHQFTAMIGTSGAVRLPSLVPKTDWATKNWCYALTDDLWITGGAISNGGLALRWARDKFARTEQYVAEKLHLDPYDVLARYAERKPPGSDGLILLPFFAGERSPYWNAHARGVLFGLNLNHGKRHLMRATLEGICYSMYSVFRSLRKISPASDQELEIKASGSFTRSAFWVQMMADVFGHPITVPGVPEGSVFGAAVMAMLGTGEIKSLGDIRTLMGPPRAIYQPNRKNHEIYTRLFDIYERVYKNLINEFDAIAEIQNELAVKS